ncbi:acetyltransferase [Kordiimonas lacus]|uniref:Transferase hexapeptide (Six repeat-containing protein) n=1 Tax=Kordiimonas lacus TaxID=637679 RepID=A0A1G6TA20_9PROT|nr:acetyltransferase [Kordiimonas lacus]SDD25863.1 transferase hexapeptide (six repeat-containing protein) [Kordiimonas lacus]
MKLYGVYGANGFGREVMPLLRQQVADSPNTTCVFVDDAIGRDSENGHRRMSFTQFLEHPAGSRATTLAIADGAVRRKLSEKCTAAGVAFAEVRAFNSVVMDMVQISEGLVLCGFTTITSNTKIGRHFHANIYSYVAHDCVIGDFVTLAPSVKVNGNVTIGDQVYIGTGAVVRQGLKIGAGATIGMGAVVIRDVAPGTTVVGNPARELIKK